MLDIKKKSVNGVFVFESIKYWWFHLKPKRVIFEQLKLISYYLLLRKCALLLHAYRHDIIFKCFSVFKHCFKIHTAGFGFVSVYILLELISGLWYINLYTFICFYIWGFLSLKLIFLPKHQSWVVTEKKQVVKISLALL